MFALPEINKLKFKNTNKSQKRRNSSDYSINYEKALKPINNTSDIIPISQIKRQNVINSKKESKRKYNNKNSSSLLNFEIEKKFLNKTLRNQLKMINHSTEKIKTEKELISKIKEYNNSSRNKKSFLNIKSNYNNLTNIFFNRQIDINKFFKEINLLLLRSNKIFEKLQNLINYKIIMRSNVYVLDQLLKKKEIPINKFNYGLIFKSIIKNTFNESLKKAFLNKSLISKKEIKEEHPKQINDIKKYLNIYNKEKKDSAYNKKFDTLIISNNSPHQYNNKLSLKKNNKKMNLIRNRRKKLIIQSNSCDNIFFNPVHYIKDYFHYRHLNINMKQKEIKEKNNSQLSNDNTPDKEMIENHIESIISKRKFDIFSEKRLNNIIKKQNSIFDDFIKLQEKIKNNELNKIKAENSFEENIKKVESYSTKQIKDDNINEDLINFFNNSAKNCKFENTLINEKINKFFFQENKIKENELNINSLNILTKNKCSINTINLENESEVKDFNLKNSISSLRDSSSQTTLFNKKNFKDKNLFFNDNTDNKQSHPKLIKEKDSHLINIYIKSRKRKEEEEKKQNENNKMAKSVLDVKCFLQTNKNFSIRNSKGFLNIENYESKLKELNNKVRGKKRLKLN